MARNRLIERTLIDLVSRALDVVHRFIEWSTSVARHVTGILTPIDTRIGRTDKSGWRVEDWKPANRACPTCPSRWVGPGSMEHLHIEACPVCAAVERKPKYVKKVKPPRTVRTVRKRYVSRGERT